MIWRRLPLRRNVVEVDEVHRFAAPMPGDLEQIAYIREAALAGKTRRDLFERDGHDGIDLDLALFELVSPAGTNVRTHPDANASRDGTRSHAIAQVFREQHRASLSRRYASSGIRDGSTFEEPELLRARRWGHTSTWLPRVPAAGQKMGSHLHLAPQGSNQAVDVNSRSAAG